MVSPNLTKSRIWVYPRWYPRLYFINSHFLGSTMGRLNDLMNNQVSRSTRCTPDGLGPYDGSAATNSSCSERSIVVGSRRAAPPGLPKVVVSDCQARY
jgi:hypothetical protein